MSGSTLPRGIMSKDEAGSMTCCDGDSSITQATTASRQDPRPNTPWHTLAVVFGAALLFFIQPVAAAQLIPLFGGAAAVWVGCLLFFQAAVLAGYAYAHLLAGWLAPRTQGHVHVSLLVTAGLLAWYFRDLAPAQGEAPLRSLLTLLALKLALPLILVSGTGPLVQHWFGLEFRHPYRLYVASNLASLGVLLGFPFLLEPLMDLSDLYLLWTVGLVAHAALCAACLPRRMAGRVAGTDETPFRYDPQRWASWLLLSGAGSLILLATTNVLAHEIAPIPMVSIPPLALYLCSFAIVFAPGEWRAPPVLVPSLFMAIAAVLADRLGLLDLGLMERMLVYNGTLFLMCLAAHGELAARKPDPQYLTEFYLASAAGSVLGALAVNFLAPGIFDSYLEFEAALVASMAIGVLAARSMSRPIRLGSAATAVVLLLLAAGAPEPDTQVSSRIFAGRNFYGSFEVRVRGEDTPSEHHVLINDGITHGLQLSQARYQPVPTTYFGVRSGVGQVLLREASAGSRRIGVVGLGAGTLATYGHEGDAYDFFEINPAMEFIAKHFFGFVRNSRAEVRLLMGDARRSLEAQAHAGAPPYDVLVVDAFNGGSIPSHLLTEEAWQLYWTRLVPDGVLALHVSNRFVDLLPVIAHLNEANPRGTLLVVNTTDDPSWGLIAASWVIVTRQQELLASPSFRASSFEPSGTEILRWTDERAPVTPLLAW